MSHLDGILIGPYDLSASFNKPGNFKTLEFKNTIKKLSKNVKLIMSFCGIHQVEPDIKSLKKLIKEGFRFLPFSTDAYVMNKASEKIFNNKF